MNCARAEELLPWLLNGSLDAAQAGSVRAHLAGCAACRTAWVDTTWVAELSASHLPAANLVDLATGVVLPGGDRVAAEAHLATCTACAAELALLRESWTAHGAALDTNEELPESRIAPGPHGNASAQRPRATRDWRNLALAASVAGMVLGGVGFWKVKLQATGDRERQAAEVERSRQEADEAKGEREAVAVRLAALEAPQLNVPLAELMPQELVLRAAPEALPVLSVPAAGRIMLLLYAPPTGAAAGDYGVELRDARGVVFWSAQGLKRQPGGDFSLSLPAEFLAEGTAEIRVLAPGDSPAVVARYRFAVRRGSGS